MWSSEDNISNFDCQQNYCHKLVVTQDQNEVTKTVMLEICSRSPTITSAVATGRKILFKSTPVTQLGNLQLHILVFPYIFSVIKLIFLNVTHKNCCVRRKKLPLLTSTYTNVNAVVSSS